MNRPKVLLYVEGGHRDDIELDLDFESDNANFRRNLTRFVGRSLTCEIQGWSLDVVLGGGRDEAIKRFNDDVENQVAEEQRRGRAINKVRILLVDSEGAIRKGQKCKAHLNSQTAWQLGNRVAENRVFLMVQCMESWFVADPNGLDAYYRTMKLTFDKSVLTEEVQKVRAKFRSAGIEQIPKTGKKITHNGEQIRNIPAFIISRALKRRDYSKNHGFGIIGFIDPDVVRAACPHCEDFLATLEAMLC
jgi:Domain of unknown function (DUF4276)